MDNNDVLRRIRFIFDFGDDKMIELFQLGGEVVTRSEVSDWLKKDEDPDCMRLDDIDLAHFLNGLIVDKRGKKEGPEPVPEKILNNNIVFKKLRIALNLKEAEILALMESVETKISKHELSAFFRKFGQTQYRPCKDQFLRKFFQALSLKYRPESHIENLGKG